MAGISVSVIRNDLCSIECFFYHFERFLGEYEDRFEKEAFAFHERVRQGYLTLANDEPERFRVIDASRDEKTIHTEILEMVLGLAGLKGP